MAKNGQSWFESSLVLAALVCAAGTAFAQDNAPTAQLATLNRRQAAAQVIAQSRPLYPVVAKVNYIQGSVRLDVTVNDRGKVQNAHVLQGDALLAEAALEASRKWTYSPLSTSTGRAGFRTVVLVRFDLRMTREAAAYYELSPRQAEHDFLLRVKPAEVKRPAQAATSPEGSVRASLLLSDHGEISDVFLSTKDQEKLSVVSEVLRRWTFEPAHWGTIPVASYLDVDIPVPAPSVAQAAVSTTSR